MPLLLLHDHPVPLESHNSLGSAKRPVRDKTARPRKGGPGRGVGTTEDPEAEHRDPGREDRETEEGKSPDRP